MNNLQEWILAQLIENEQKELYNKSRCEGVIKIDKNNSDNYGGFHFILHDRNGKRIEKFSCDRVPGLCEGVSEKQMHKKDNILKRSA